MIADGTFSIAGLTGASTSIQHLTGSGAVDLGAKALTLSARERYVLRRHRRHRRRADR